MPRRRTPQILALLVAAAAGASAAAGPDADKIIAGAEAVLRVNDPDWLDRQTTQFAATAGLNPAPLRATLAAMLFTARSFDGIDLHRPALIAWRSAPSPLVAIIPLSDRRKFMKGFGAVPGFGEPLVHVGERDGTDVYSQNSDKTIYEYRLLVQDDTAYVARTVDECRALAAQGKLRAPSNAPPLAFESKGGFLADGVGSAALPALPTLADADAMIGFAALSRALKSLPDLAQQVQAVSWTLGAGEGEGAVRLSLKLSASAGTPLAGWMANQRNQASRLLPVVSSPDSFLTIHGGIAWQGEMERLGVELAKDLGRQAGAERWTPAVEDAWMQQWAILDQQGSFAGACDLTPATGEHPAAFSSRFVCEQPRGAELPALEHTVASALSPTGVAPALPQEVAVGARTGVIRTTGEVATVRVATETHVVQVSGAADAVVAAADDLLKRLQGAAKPEGTPGIVVVHLDLTRLIGTLATTENQPQPTLPAVAFDIAAKATNQASVAVDLDLPLGQVATLLRDSMLLQKSGAKLEGEDAPPKK